MEIAIPLIALGGMYVISNQPNNNSKNRNERFTNMGIRSNLGVQTGNYLPNTKIPPQNFPVENLNEISTDVREFKNPNAASDKYFDQNIYEQRTIHNETVSNNPQQIYSMTGNYLDTEQFKHNNMKPFMGGKPVGYTYKANVAESQLDNMVGAGTHTIEKIEQAPLFKPEENMAWAYGAPNNSDFFQSRQNPAMRVNSVKPFDTVMVGPGLDKGYCVDGSGGYNSGMEARDKWLPYTVDQLRVDTNPKLEYKLTNLEGPANSFIKQPGNIETQGRVEKQRPDTFFINSQDRWLTTTGATKGETLRSEQEMGIIRRNDVLTDYTGPAGNNGVKASYAPENFEPSRKPILPCNSVNHSSAVGKGAIDENHIFKTSFTNYHNNRSTVNQPDRIRSGFSGAIGAVIAPLLDVLRPTLKEEVVNNIRIFGDMTSSVSKGPVYNPQEGTNTTIKETTLYSPNFNINNQKEGIYVNNYSNPDLTQRDTTSAAYDGPPGGGATGWGDMNYSAAYNQHNNDIKSSTIAGRTNQGGMQIFNQEMNIHCRDDCDRFAGRMNPAFSSAGASPPSIQTYGNINVPQYYNECAGCDRINPDILDAFRSNPYTQSLTTSV
uniref:Uncharacterized protein n=1 Tax=viral metagenome TaxID=1070528 RepID=A0A6C0LND1_9ZZZZ